MYHFKLLTIDDISPRTLVLSLLNSIDTDTQTIGELVQAAKAFDIDATALRVAVTRLVKDGYLENPERGVYSGGQKAEPLTRQIRNWQTAPDVMINWDGGWLIHLTHHLGRTNRKQLRQHDRAFSMFGYREAETGLWVRPANLATPLDQHRLRLTDLGADAGMISFRTDKPLLPAAQDWAALWDVDALKACYREAISVMDASLDGLSALSVQDKARETFLVGQSVIRAINLDPLLPSELGDQTGFRQMVQKMRAYNKKGRAAWRSFQSNA